ncbi:hypothetical protein BKA25_004428 [Actinoalloteichus hymeniacidonis]|nr:hypothetical protein [Actinoalloteichus hymeniacidonis]MBB5910112.1 hypothetical protein [Actinoalloteichus hymeniacidonis]
MKIGQPIRGIQPKLGTETLAKAFEHVECTATVPNPSQRRHELDMETLVERMLTGQQREVVYDFAVPAEFHCGIDGFRVGLRALPLDVLDSSSQRTAGFDVLQGATAPQPQGFPEHGQRLSRVLVAHCRTSVADCGIELLQVQLILGKAEHVTVGPGLDQRLSGIAELSPDLVDVGLDGLAR